LLNEKRKISNTHFLNSEKRNLSLGKNVQSRCKGIQLLSSPDLERKSLLTLCIAHQDPTQPTFTLKKEKKRHFRRTSLLPRIFTEKANNPRFLRKNRHSIAPTCTKNRSCLEKVIISEILIV